MFFVLWKVSYNYLLDIKQVYEAPRIIKILKIVREFSPNADDPNQYYGDQVASRMGGYPLNLQQQMSS